MDYQCRYSNCKMKCILPYNYCYIHFCKWSQGKEALCGKDVDPNSIYCKTHYKEFLQNPYLQKCPMKFQYKKFN